MSDLIKPITITLYDAQDEPIKTCSRARVPAEIMLQAMELVEKLQESGIDEKTLQTETATSADVRALFEALGAFIVEVFGGQFNLGELLKGSEISDMLAVLFAVANKASSIAAANPTFRPAQRKPLKRK